MSGRRVRSALLRVLTAAALLASALLASAPASAHEGSQYDNECKGTPRVGSDERSCNHHHGGRIYVEAPANGRFRLREGTSVTYGIRINEKPGATLTVTPQNSWKGGGDPTLAAPSLGTTVSGPVSWSASGDVDWQQTKYVTVTYPEDSKCTNPIVGGYTNREFVRNLGSGGGSRYGSFTDSGRHWNLIVSFEMIDNDCGPDGSGLAPDLIVSSNQFVANSPRFLRVDEGGASKSYTVKLNRRPDATVTIYADSSDALAASVTPASRTFTQQNWNTPQRFTVTGERDADGGRESVVISHRSNAVSSSEWWEHRNLKLKRVFVVVVDTGSGSGVLPAHGPAQDPDAPDFDALIPQMYQWRNDPQWVAHKSHTDRWDRALLALGEPAADAGLTAMSGAEAQGYADESWGARWVPVAKAIKWTEAGGQRPERVGRHVTEPEEPEPDQGGTLEVPDTTQPTQGTPLGGAQPGEPISGERQTEQAQPQQQQADQQAQQQQAQPQQPIAQPEPPAQPQQPIAEPEPPARPQQQPEPQQQEPQQEPEPEPASEGWRAYDTNGTGCIDMAGEYMKAVYDYAAAKVSADTVREVVANFC